MDELALRKSRQDHIRQPRQKSPFHDRIAALAANGDWYNWAGYHAAHSIFDDELEYFAIRSTAGLFDISPMTKYLISGADAERFLNFLTLRDVTKLKAGRVQYTAWCNDEGHVLDDGTLFRLAADRFLLCCQERHLPWLIDSAGPMAVDIADATDRLAGLALQGPTSFAVLAAAGLTEAGRLRPFDLMETEIDGLPLTISRTGFTGDLGYELITDAGHAASLWDRLWSAGAAHGLQAVGYGAINRARIEAGFIVANADFITAESAMRHDRVRLPDEIGLDWMIDEHKAYFNGRQAILAARREGRLKHCLVGLAIDGNQPAELSIVYHRKTREAGLVTAGIWSPTAKRNIALATLERPFGTEIRDNLWVEIYALKELKYQKLMKRAVIVERPFIRLARRAAMPPGLK